MSAIMTDRQRRLGLFIAASIGVGVWVLYWLVLLIAPVEASSFWWWLGFPLMLIASWLLGGRFRHKAWQLGAVMMFANMVIAIVFVQGAGNLLPFAVLFYVVMAIPCALLAHSRSKEH